ncbi:hypothetical protein [Paenibacillus sp. CF384]|uniref:hypothetical protein n=1 Tax=Paenibacillus sp. CF384 TaxID=1884382 RepID=UPI00089498AF|nr:hypothetical protein [Paenibacillus sp. CF384]SDX34776.1 hypothetical protein SAMN05518855_1012164 [Paenibacillus sp. CF384]
MAIELNVAHCPNCGRVFQKNLRNLCAACTAEEDGQITSIEQVLRRNRQLTNEQLAEQTSVPVQQIRSYIRKGKLKLFDYPNLSDACDLCSEPTRHGKLCVKCVSKLKDDIMQDREKVVQKKEHVFLSKYRR